jgi:hypothetical protein
LPTPNSFWVMIFLMLAFLPIFELFSTPGFLSKKNCRSLNSQPISMGVSLLDSEQYLASRKNIWDQYLRLMYFSYIFSLGGTPYLGNVKNEDFGNFM